MNILAGLETFLYVISSALFYPVVVGLILLTFWVVISLGSLLRDYLDRRQGRSAALQQYARMLDSEVLTQAANLDLELENRLQVAELELIKGLDKIRFAIRVGPAVGLMGTLIPMGISLAALAQGDMPKMAGSMVTAFTATVVGLACGVAAYLMSLVREKWVRADMREMEYLTELRLRKAKGPRLNKRAGEEDELFEKTAAV
jgi:biopolymer transport protein ExbB/TolQ